jgi:hypothetical protein
MTTVFLLEKTCFICGRKSNCTQTETPMTTAGSKDLDGRPSQILRASVYMWVQRCIFCGYCASDISLGLPEEKAVVQSGQYVAQLSNKDFPETANSFLCRALINEHNGRFSEGGWASVYAAWVCDDNQFTKAAEACRGKALALFVAARNHQQAICETAEDELILIIDLMRRKGDFDAALALCEPEIQKPYSEETLSLLNFEKSLIDANDSSCHRTSEAKESDDNR